MKRLEKKLEQSTSSSQDKQVESVIAEMVERIILSTRIILQVIGKISPTLLVLFPDGQIAAFLVSKIPGNHQSQKAYFIELGKNLVTAYPGIVASGFVFISEGQLLRIKPQRTDELLPANKKSVMVMARDMAGNEKINIEDFVLNEFGLVSLDQNRVLEMKIDNKWHRLPRQRIGDDNAESVQNILYWLWKSYYETVLG